MEEEKKTQGEETKPMTQEEAREQYALKLAEMREKVKEANEAMSEGRGRLTLETEIKCGDRTVTELEYDFTALTGMEYTDAMDSDPNAGPSAFGKITYRQGLALFAKAAAKQTDGADMDDIVTRMGATDAVEAVQLATLFFTASSRAGRMRISKK